MVYIFSIGGCLEALVKFAKMLAVGLLFVALSYGVELLLAVAAIASTCMKLNVFVCCSLHARLLSAIKTSNDKPYIPQQTTSEIDSSICTNVNELSCQKVYLMDSCCCTILGAWPRFGLAARKISQFTRAHTVYSKCSTWLSAWL